MGLTHALKAPRPGHRGPGQRSTRQRSSRTSPLLAATALLGGLLALLLGAVGPASAAPAPPPPSFPVSVAECGHGGYADFPELGFRNRGQCTRWVQQYIVRPACHEAALADFQDDGPTFARQLGLPLGRFIATVCRGQDFPVSNAWYVVDNPAGTDLLSLASGNTAPFTSKVGYIYWIQVQGTWQSGPFAVDATYVSTDGWATWADGPFGMPRQTATQVEHRFVDWGAYDAGHHYEYWIHGNGMPLNMRVFEGNAFLNVPNPAAYADNSFPGIGGGMPAIVFEYQLWRWPGFGP